VQHYHHVLPRVPAPAARLCSTRPTSAASPYSRLAACAINVNSGSRWSFLLQDAFLIVNTMRSSSMNDEVYLSELRRSIFPPENNFRLNHDSNASVKPINHFQKNNNEMIIGPWYLDEFGNPTREIKARD
jgi:hypothetical protein